MIERQKVITWFTPEEKLPTDENMVVVTLSGKDGNITHDHALGIANWYDSEEGYVISGWAVEGLSDSAEFVIHAWCDLEPYREKRG